MAFDRYDVVTALFPFSELDVRKPRPALVLSGALFNREHGHLVASMITTGARSRWPSDHVTVDLAGTGLSHRSVVRWKLFTLPFTVIGRRIGALSPADRKAVEAKLRTILIG
jgi:mRNA-degrading endonuclease toxin of MazEF toxin-antitoxin module